jgi:hypothetical protein
MISKRKILKEASMLKDLPDDVKQAIMQNRTSLGNNPAIPDIFDVPYLYKAALKQFEKSKEDLKSVGDIDVDASSTEEALSKLILKCKKEEEPYRNELEKICYNYLIDYFSIPEDSVDIKLSLVDNIDLNKESIALDSDDSEFDFDDINQAKETRSEVYKRRMLDSLCMGGGLYKSELDDSIISEIQEINPNLPNLYRQITALNAYTLFTKEDFGLSEENKMQIGTVEVVLGSDDEKVVIDAQGVVFPILVCEAFRGFYELFISHGLPKGKDLAIAVLKKADFLKAEPWDMRIGPHIWEMFMKAYNDISSKDEPYLIKRFASLDIEHFNFLMKEILAGTKKGKRIMASICSKAKNDREYEKFVDRMDKMKANKGIITDDFIHPDEL